MAASLNGMIAKANDDTSWISVDEWNSYSAAVRAAGNVVVGHRTYDILTKQPEFSEFKDVQLVVVSTKTVPLVATNHSIAKSPHEAIELLKNFETIIIAGGGILNAAFLKEQLIDELFVDIEPILIGNGIPLFASDETMTQRLNLLGQKMISEHEIQLHYEIKK